MDTRTRILLWERDDGKCQICQGPGQEADHVIPRSHFGKRRRAERDALDNYRLLCTPCHRRRHDGGILSP